MHPSEEFVARLMAKADTLGFVEHYNCGKGGDDPDPYTCGKEIDERETLAELISEVLLQGFLHPEWILADDETEPTYDF